MSTSRKESKRKGLTGRQLGPDDYVDDEEEEYYEIKLPTIDEREYVRLQNRHRASRHARPRARRGITRRR